MKNKPAVKGKAKEVKAPAKTTKPAAKAPAKKEVKAPAKATKPAAKAPAKKEVKAPAKATKPVTKAPAKKEVKAPAKATKPVAKAPAKKEVKAPAKATKPVAKAPAKKEETIKDVKSLAKSKATKPVAKAPAKKELKKTEIKVRKNIKKIDYIEPTYGTETINYDDIYDEGDIASAIEMGFISKALEAHKAKVAPESHPDFDGEHCIDCDVVIHKVRLGLGKIRCIDCQTELEKKEKMRSKR